MHTVSASFFKASIPDIDLETRPSKNQNSYYETIGCGTTHVKPPTYDPFTLPPCKTDVIRQCGRNGSCETEMWYSGRVSGESRGGTRIIAPVAGPRLEKV